MRPVLVHLVVRIPVFPFSREITEYKCTLHQLGSLTGDHGKAVFRSYPLAPRLIHSLSTFFLGDHDDPDDLTWSRDEKTFFLFFSRSQFDSRTGTWLELLQTRVAYAADIDFSSFSIFQTML